MRIILDTADLKTIKELYEVFPISGITTNPSIVSKEKRNPFEVLKEIREFIGDDDLHVEVLGRTAEEIEKEAEAITKELGKETFIKIPVTTEGLKAIRNLHQKGYKTTATAVLTLSQAYLAAMNGADFVAPYVNRIDNFGASGTETAIDIDDAFRMSDYETKVIAASFKNVKQVEEMIKADVYSVTLPPDLLRAMLHHPGTDEAVAKFEKDFSTLDYGMLMLAK
ncbi:MAG: hypothetical protein KBS81_07075 [Spirochaetales bacterium]|nr:hypothetical protein [Candidatus Physcosoma equi]